MAIAAVERVAADIARSSWPTSSDASASALTLVSPSARRWATATARPSGPVTPRTINTDKRASSPNASRVMPAVQRMDRTDRFRAASNAAAMFAWSRAVAVSSSARSVA